jgi:hypothetical protein
MTHSFVIAGDGTWYLFHDPEVMKTKWRGTGSVASKKYVLRWHKQKKH